MAAELDDERRRGRTVGLVPTMGALHAGHASLIRRAAEECDVVVVSVFVNPKQFGAAEDLDAYPRRLEQDTHVASASGATHVFAPTSARMYPSGFRTTVHVEGVTGCFEGAARPGHFDGVTTVVAKLFAIGGRCRAYFGEKDFQQLQVVRRLALDLSLPVEVVGCPTVREADGLARSSRNVYLGARERAVAPILHRALRAGACTYLGGRRDPAAVRSVMTATVATEPMVDLDYAEVVDATTLGPPVASGEVRFLIAGRVGGVRLIDNIGL